MTARKHVVIMLSRLRFPEAPSVSLADFPLPYEPLASESKMRWLFRRQK